MKVQRSAFIGCSASDTFDLIEKAENYPAFLPWCAGAVILERTDDIVAARLTFRHRGIEFEMTTRNPKRRPDWMAIRMERGPFRHFEGEWHLTALAPSACKIVFDLRYELGGSIARTIAAPVFDRIANTLVDAYVARAEATLTSRP